MRTRSRERIQFLTDVLTTAVEGGIGYWSELRGYLHEAPHAHAVIVDYEDGEKYHVDIETIAHGLNEVSRSHDVTGMNHKARQLITAANRENDFAPAGYRYGDIDSEVADMVLQVALFGEVRYG
ncbi:hypothetical protein [Nocardia terpenica]|uniref:Uncharacterized protein n=1 Tax=Nocardia terpenica TaxID=455432 RepID=A0A161X768_9NOCA|nr:hypothetical protein [Nocardia terpenica]KZM68858.1 hypothetical protein AWN90_13800 [Nocardia terpenica]NQE88098.1 hypothetical protein [Nocardia terpenica]